MSTARTDRRGACSSVDSVAHVQFHHMRKITHLYQRRCSAALAGRLALFAFWHRSNLTTPLTSRRIFRCSPSFPIIAGTAPRIPSQTDSLRASSHGWASSTRDGDVAHRQVDHLVDRLIGGKNAMIARHLAQRHIDGFGCAFWLIG